jgi:hypothetical protein
MSQATAEELPRCRVVGIVRAGERVVISENVGRAVAEKIMALMSGAGRYYDIFIECDGKQLSPRPR